MRYQILSLKPGEIPKYIVFVTEAGIYKVYLLVSGSRKSGLALQAVPEPVAQMVLRQYPGAR